MLKMKMLKFQDSNHHQLDIQNQHKDRLNNSNIFSSKSAELALIFLKFPYGFNQFKNE